MVTSLNETLIFVLFVWCVIKSENTGIYIN